jgi:two-component system NtrC family response regulator
MPAELRRPKAALYLPEALEAIEEQMIRRALEKSGQVQVRAAEMLGITKSLLQYKLKKYHLTT